MERRNPFAGRNPLFLGAVCAALGIGLAEWTRLPVLPAEAIYLATLASFFWVRRDWAVWLQLVAAFVVLHAIALRPECADALREKVSAKGRLIRATGVIIDEPKSKEDSRFFRFPVQLESVRLNDVTFPCDIVVNVAWPDESPRYGDRIEVLGFARNVLPARNPGQFDYAAYLRRKGILTEIWLREAQDGKVLSSGGGNALVERSQRFRKWTHDMLTLDLEADPQVAAVIASMVLGTADEAADQLAEAFRSTGTFHLFAVSGFNVAILALIVQWMLQPFGLHRGSMSPVVIIPILVFYALVTGLGASSVRATLMAAVLLAAAWSDRPARIVNTLGASGLLILAWDTQQMFQAGFQLSFLVVLALLVFAEPVHGFLKRFGAPDPFIPPVLLPRWRQWLDRRRIEVLGLFAASFAASLGSTPLMLYHFHSITPVGLIANIVAVPLATVILGLGILSLLGGAISSSWAVLINNANWGLTKVLLVSIDFFAAIPGGSFHATLPEWRAPPAEIVVYDLEKSSLLLLRAGRETWLLGAGHSSEFERQTRSFLFARGLDRITGLVATAPSSAHLGAADDLVEQFRPPAVFDSPLPARSPYRRALDETLEDLKQAKRIVARGDVLSLPTGATLRVLYPPADLVRTRADDKAFVLQLETAAGQRVLFLTDAGESTERWLLEHGPLATSDVLVFGEHSKETSGTPGLLRAVQPRLIVRHERNRTFRPSRDEDDGGRPRFRPPAEAIYLRTENEGAVTIRLAADAISARGFLSGREVRVETARAGSDARETTPPRPH